MNVLKYLFLIYLIFYFPGVLFSFQNDSTYYPLSLGNTWDYQSDFDPHSETVVDTLRANGNLYFGISRSVEFNPEFWFREDNNRIYCIKSPESSEIILFDFTIEPGDSIELPVAYDCSFGRKIFLVSKFDSVITPADTFQNCYHFHHQPHCADAGRIDTWFSRGTGIVKYVSNSFGGYKEFLLADYTITGVKIAEDNSTINSFNLLQNYPNPFNPTTTITYSLLNTSLVTLKVYDILGREVATLVNEEKLSGSYEIEFDGSNLSSGVYFYRMRATPSGGQAGDFIDTKKFVLLK